MELRKVLSIEDRAMEKARSHKYIQRKGAPGKFQYIYRMEEAEKEPEAFNIIPYSPDLKITNLDQLPRGTGAKYLEVLPGHKGDLIALRWRKLPVYDAGHKIIDMTAGKTYKMEGEPPKVDRPKLYKQWLEMPLYKRKQFGDKFENFVTGWWSDNVVGKKPTYKMEGDVPVLPLNREAKKFVIRDLDRKLGIQKPIEKFVIKENKKWLFKE